MPKIPKHTLAPVDVQVMTRDFERFGCLEISDFLSVDQMEAIQSEAALAAPHRGLKVGDGRFMTPVQVENNVNLPGIYGNPVIVELMSNLLGEDFVLSCFTRVTSLPGAAVQHQHRDYPGLFQQPVDYFSPSYAINLLIPLIALNEQTGTTRMWPGTHRKPGDANADDGVSPYAPLGSALLMDYRLLHQGTANRSDKPRPLLCLGYARSWFLDTINFKNISPVNISDAEYEKVEEPLRRLFARRFHSGSE